MINLSKVPSREEHEKAKKELIKLGYRIAHETYEDFVRDYCKFHNLPNPLAIERP